MWTLLEDPEIDEFFLDDVDMLKTLIGSRPYILAAKIVHALQRTLSLYVYLGTPKNCLLRL